MRTGASAAVLLALTLLSGAASRCAQAFTLIEKRLPVTVEVTPDQTFNFAHLLYAGYTDAQHTNLFQTSANLGLLPAVQRTTINTVLTVPANDFSPVVTILMCDGSVRLAMGMNGPSANAAIGKTYDQLFVTPGTNTPTEQTMIDAVARGDTATVNAFYKQFLDRLGSPLNITSILIGLSTATQDGTEQIIERPQGDANFDGNVGFDDLVILARNYQRANATWSQGDFNGDGVVDFKDLVILARNYNQTITPGQAAQLGPQFSAQVTAAFQEVPEPTWICWLVPAALALPRRRRPTC